jgi:hypothetical protein
LYASHFKWMKMKYYISFLINNFDWMKVKCNEASDKLSSELATSKLSLLCFERVKCSHLEFQASLTACRIKSLLLSVDLTTFWCFRFSISIWFRFAFDPFPRRFRSSIDRNRSGCLDLRWARRLVVLPSLHDNSWESVTNVLTVKSFYTVPSINFTWKILNCWEHLFIFIIFETVSLLQSYHSFFI